MKLNDSNDEGLPVPQEIRQFEFWQRPPSRHKLPP